MPDTVQALALPVDWTVARNDSTVSTQRSFPTWLERLLLLVGSPLLFVLVAELAIFALDIETDVARNDNAQIAVPVWLLADEAWVAERQADLQAGSNEPMAAADLAWMYYFEEARWIQYRMKPSVDVRVVNPFNKIEVEKAVDFRLHSNSAGFRGEEIRPKRPDVTRIVTIGDSSTFGWGAEPEHTFQHMLENKLNDELAGRYEIINLGIPGQNSRHGLGMLRHYALPLEPDLLLVSYGSNDPRVTPTPTDELLAADDTWVGGLRFRMLRWRGYRLLRRLLFTLRNPLSVDSENPQLIRTAPAVPVDDYRENMMEIVLTAQEASIRTMLMSVCTGVEVYVANINNVAKWTDTPIVNVGVLFKEHRDALIDGTLYPEKVAHYRSMYGRRVLRRQPQYYVTNDGCHPNWVGHSLIADEMLPLVGEALGVTPGGLNPGDSP